MTHKFSVQIENTPDTTGEVDPEVTRFDVYIAWEHDSHTDNEHSGFWGQVRLDKPLPFYCENFDGNEEGLTKLKALSQPAYWYATGLIDAAELMDDFEWDAACEGCQKALMGAA